MNKFTEIELKNEIWKDIPGYEELYQISNLGRVKSLEREILRRYKVLAKEKILKSNISKDGYYKVSLCKDSKGKNYKVHQLVAMAFLNHIPCGREIEVNHKDEDKTNNRLENLELLTYEEHLKFTYRNATSKYIGVCFNKKTNKWLSAIKINGKSKGLGSFKTELEAYEARKKAEEFIKIGELDFMKIKEKTSKYKGVSFNKQNNKWGARIAINSEFKFLGYFHNEEDAYNTILKSKQK